MCLCVFGYVCKPVCTHTQIHKTATNVSDWLDTKPYASEDTFPSFKAGAPGDAVLFQAEFHPICLQWEDDSISIPCVSPPGSGSGKYQLNTKDSTVNRYDWANLLIRCLLPFSCLLFALWALRTKRFTRFKPAPFPGI